MSRLPGRPEQGGASGVEEQDAMRERVRMERAATRGARRRSRLAAGVLAAAALCAGPMAARGGAPDAVGVEVDLLPTVLSAMAGEPGGALQGWVRWKRDRLRLVGATLHFPDSLTDAPFAGHRSTAAALLYDRFLTGEGTGPWLGGGLEYWWSSIGLESGPERGAWQGPVATAGGGWVFPVWRGLYLNPWGAVHVPLTGGDVAVGPETYHPRGLVAEVSLKVGWSFDLGR
jgi:hypothetical protein